MKLSLTSALSLTAVCLAFAGTLTAADSVPPSAIQGPIQIKARRDLTTAPITPMMRKLIDESWKFYASAAAGQRTEK